MVVAMLSSRKFADRQRGSSVLWAEIFPPKNREFGCCFTSPGQVLIYFGDSLLFVLILVSYYYYY